jgi:hypothetical protein
MDQNDFTAEKLAQMDDKELDELKARPDLSHGQRELMHVEFMRRACASFQEGKKVR